MKGLPVLLTLCAWVLPGVADAQFLKKINPFDSIPEVTVVLTHPPTLGHQIEEIRKVAFAEAEGECADDLADALVSIFVSNGVEVLDRQNLDAVLDEHKFSASGLVDRGNAAELGKILGASALIFVKVRRCATTEQHSTNHRKGITGQVIYEYIAQTNGYFKGSIQVVDLSTARIYSARAIDESVVRRATSSNGPPQAPDHYEAIDAVVRRAADRVHEMFFPWTERRTLRFYDGKDCNSNLAYNLVNSGQIFDAVNQSAVNVEDCEIARGDKPKVLSRAYYNLGMAHCLANDFDAGIDALNASLRLRPHEPTSEAIAECRRAKVASQRMEEFNDETDAAGAAPPPEESGKPVAEQVATLIGLYEKDLLTKEMCRARIEELLSRRGAPGAGPEEQLSLLKDYLERGLIGQETYETLVERVLSTI